MRDKIDLGTYGYSGTVRTHVIELSRSAVTFSPYRAGDCVQEFSEIMPHGNNFLCHSIQLDGIQNLDRSVTGKLRLLVMCKEVQIAIPAWLLRCGTQFVLPKPYLIGELLQYKWSLDFHAHPGNDNVSLWMIGSLSERS